MANRTMSTGAIRSARQDARPGGRGLSRRIVLAGNVVLIALGVLVLRNVVLDAPALSPGLRLAAPGESWRPRDGKTLYDRSLYFSERAEAFLGGDDATRLAPEAIVIALELALDSVESAPGDARTWTLIAATAAASGFPDVARTALAQSRMLAPNTGSLALERLRLVGLHEQPLSATDRAAVAHDLAIARRVRASELAELREQFPELARVFDRVENARAERARLD